jgi:chromosome segregation ATPase
MSDPIAGAIRRHDPIVYAVANPQPPPPQLSPEQIAADLFSSGPSTMMAVPFDLQQRITALVQSKQDDIDKLRTRAEQAEARVEKLSSELRSLRDQKAELATCLLHCREGREQAECERDEALEGLREACKVLPPVLESSEAFAADLSGEPRADEYAAENEAVRGWLRRAKEIIEKLEKK